MPQKPQVSFACDDGAEDVDDVKRQVLDFVEACEPQEASSMSVFTDGRNGARYCLCHVRASKLLSVATIDVPLDPEAQPDYRANREIEEDHAAYEQMKLDACARRSFNGLVCEYTTAFDEAHPVKVIGGQHRYNAIRLAGENGIDEWHGLQVYFGLDPDQRLDVQVISNTNIQVSPDWIDRVYETQAGPELRDWCQTVGLLDQGQDFISRRQKGKSITVRDARTFVLNFYRGKSVGTEEFNETDTTPSLARSGSRDPDWEALRQANPTMWGDPALIRAGKEFALLAQVQRDHFRRPKARKPAKRSKVLEADFAEKTFNYAILSAWAYVAGLLQANPTRLDRHYNLRAITGRDPLNAAALAKGRHKTDPDNYRGLGTRNDSKERGRCVELFYKQAEKGEGISPAVIETAIARYHAKKAVLEAKLVEAKHDIT